MLALQGDFPDHIHSLHRHGVHGLAVRTKSDLNQVRALIIPGGESTVIAKLLKSSGMDQEIVKRAKAGMPILGTCAGAILLARKVHSPVELETSLSLLDVEIERNSYGRQTESFVTELSVRDGRDGRDVTREGDYFTVEAMFIRAPRIIKTGRLVQVLAEYKGDPVLVRRKNILAGTFHSEFKHPDPVLEYFLDMVK